MDIVWVYAVLRTVPSKLWDVAAMFACMILPMVWPWARAWRFHASATRGAWTVSCLGLLVCWLGLTYLGTQPPTEATIVWSRGLALYDFAFFLILPFFLVRFVPPALDQRTEVFV